LANSTAVGLINRSGARLRRVRPRAHVFHRSSIGLRCVAPSGRSVAAFGRRRRLPTCLLRHVRCWWFSRRCIDSRPAATPSHRVVASLHTVIAVTSRGRRWLLPRHLPRRGMSPSAHGLRRAAGFFLAHFEHRCRTSTGNLHGPPGRRRSR
jgi:hypothetical protein